MANAVIKKNTSADRPVLKDKNALIDWVNEQSVLEKEYSWSESCWNDAVDKAKEIKKANKEDNGSALVKGKLVGKKPASFTESPVDNYFILRKLPKYREEELKQKAQEDEQVLEDVKKEFGTAVVGSSGDGSSSFEDWINLFGAEDQKYLRSRFNSYNSSFEITSASDESILMQILANELLLYRLNKSIVNPNYKPRTDDIKQRDTLSTQLKNLLSEQQWTQKSQGKKDTGENHFSSWLLKLFNEGYVTPKIEVDPDEVDLIMRDIRNTIEDMRM